ncbi:GNAT family N-acetyltransferase [Candidatus Halobonum tyrrellensis]|uniref:GCN5-related N-acetyltransferase n=1 Tax=Candidatus Halobonum tyrrellensis G22 TaxID=1324957 RepID=V4HCJ3_9EURY|nr:GNAT family protein [Candidatus Halobonum tyrrellensis]ESP87778.1 GCN5-related N-acetyltransferase [Candidatus Halobonum tyrrellensis G22]
MFPERIETERLRLDRHDAAVDALAMYDGAGRRRSDTVGEETRFLQWRPHEHPKESHDVTERFRESWEDREAATYAVFPREGEDGAGEYAGNAGLHVDWEKRTGTLGVWLRKPFWGRGYSGERALALASLAFDRLDLELLSVGALPDNDRSLRAIEKYVDRLGGRREGRLRNWVVSDDDDPRDMVRFSVSRAEYDASDPDPEVRFVADLPDGE